MADAKDELVFAPLGGLGEIGMNASLYGFGPKGRRKWILVDLGVAFAGPDLPGVDLIMPDISFVESVRKDLLGLVITHAHEDHVGAIASLWPKLRCPIYATPFAAGLLEVRRLGEPGAPKVDMRIVAQGSRFDLGPFSIEYIPVSHSIPESSALAIRTALGTVLHSGDWKRDATPIVGLPTDEARLRAIGDEGVLALVCDSTNIMREGESPSEADVAATLRDLIAKAKRRVVVTTFASNVARLRSVAEAAQACGRSVVIAGRAMERCVQVARECGYLDGLAPFLSVNSYGNIPGDRMVLLATGSQGEPRAAMMRIATEDHPEIKLDKGDLAIFSSRAIPGNEKNVNESINGLVDLGVTVLTDRDGLVHASGHPRRGEVAKLYEWIRPQIAIPAHGEPMHLATHAEFARGLGVPHVASVRNGDVMLLAPGEPGIIDQTPHGRVYKDGDVLIGADDESLHARKRLAFAGIVSVGLALTSKGELAGEADVVMAGLPAKSREGKPMDEIIDEAIFSAFDGLPRAKRRDADSVSVAIERAVRNTVRNAWGKRPTVHVLVMPV
jgi:ribonuclease J